MKKILLFLALWSSVACAMQTDVADLNSAEQDQVSQSVVNSIIEQSSQLTSTERQQSVDQAAEKVQELVNSCGNDKKLLKTTLSQRIKNLLRHPIVSGSIAVTVISCLEIALLTVVSYALAQGISFVAAMSFGKQLLITKWFSQSNCLFVLGMLNGLNWCYWLMFYDEIYKGE